MSCKTQQLPAKSIRLLAATILMGVSHITHAQQTAKSFTAYETLKIGYLEYLPPDYKTSTKKHPVIIFLHGSGELGNGSPEELERVASWGPPSHIKNGHTMCFTVNGEEECFIVISPQLMNDSYDWSYIVAPVVDHILNGPNQYKVDPDRIYLTGLSRGGKGTYSFASSIRNKPNKIAAIAPMAALSDVYDAGCIISERKIPVWAFHGDLDHIVPYGQGLLAFNSVKFCSNPEPTAEMLFTTYQGRYHDAWIPGYDPTHTYHNPNVYEWFLQKTRTPTDEDVTAIEESEGASPFLTYPNPCHNELLLAAEESGYLPDVISLLNLAGDVVLVIKDKPARIDISRLNAGVYVLRYEDAAGKIRSHRVVKI